MHYRGSVGQYIPYNSVLHRLDPRSKIILTLILAVGTVMADYPNDLAIMLIVSLGVVKISRARWEYMYYSLKPFGVIILITALLQVFLIPGEPIINIGGVTVSRTGAEAGLELAIRLLAIIIIIRILTITSTAQELTAGLSKLMLPLEYLKLPVHELIMIMGISLRFIPLYMEEWERIKTAQACRGVVFDDGSPVRRIRQLVSVLVPLIRSSFERATEIAISMEARCYDSKSRRSSIYNLKMSVIDWLAVLTGAGFTIAVILL